MRFLFARRTASLSAALLCTFAIVAACAGSAGAATPTVAPTWSAQQPYGALTITGSSTPTGTVALMTSVACPSYGDCVAAGVAESETAASPAIAIESNGQWGNPVAVPLPANGDATAQAEFTSVACSSASSCVAVGQYSTTSSAALGKQAFAVPFTVSGATATLGTAQQVTLPSGALATTGQGAFLSGVSCAASCTAVGTYENGSSVWTPMVATQGAGGTWTATAVTVPSGATSDTALNAISCPSTGACEAVGTYGDASSHEQSWIVQIDGGTAGTSQPVTVPGTGTISPSAPQPAGILSLRSGLTSVSCPSAGACTTVGSFESSIASEPLAVAAPITQGAIGTFSTLPSSGAVGYVTGVACWDASDCVASGLSVNTGGTGLVASATGTSEVNGNWSSTVVLQDPSAPADATETISLPEGIACSSPGVCAMTGFSLAETGTGPPSGSETEGSFFAYSAVPPTVTTSSLPTATVGKPYSATLQSSGGAGNSSWSVTAGSLPAGLTLNAATGVISGTPKASGQTGFIATATNAGPPSLSSNVGLSITVGAVASVKTAYTMVSGNTATIVVSCANARCAGAFKLTGVEHLRGKTPTAVVARTSKRTITLASGHYSLNAGSAKAIKVKLNGKGVTLLHKLGKIRGRLTLTPTGARKPALIKTLTFRYKRAKR